MLLDILILILVLLWFGTNWYMHRQKIKTIENIVEQFKEFDNEVQKNVERIEEDAEKIREATKRLEEKLDD